ncbi:hypothetical protein SAMN05421759_11176 [Roseivivax lentus]|uniref:Uncharacterized protein n=1 Tax=Roseivivax lentus TaxID=633194 RepID=A0A1N7NZR0_9RHOB|nr:hypothetical protein SAMN05421759_11176 [Roseivivax lentus]
MSFPLSVPRRRLGKPRRSGLVFLERTCPPGERRRMSPLRKDRFPGRAPRPKRVIAAAGLLASRVVTLRGPSRTSASSGMCRARSPLTVAGAAVDSHHVPYSPGSRPDRGLFGVEALLREIKSRSRGPAKRSCCGAAHGIARAARLAGGALRSRNGIVWVLAISGCRGLPVAGLNHRGFLWERPRARWIRLRYSGLRGRCGGRFRGRSEIFLEFMGNGSRPSLLPYFVITCAVQTI